MLDSFHSDGSLLEDKLLLKILHDGAKLIALLEYSVGILSGPVTLPVILN